MPPTSRLVELRADERAVEGGIIELRMREFGIVPMHWKCRWKQVEPPHLLVDEMVEGPFQSFVHHHRFEAMDKMRTRMVDEIHYTMRGGLLGHVVSITVFRVYLMMMFAWRKHQTRKLFNEG